MSLTVCVCMYSLFPVEYIELSKRHISRTCILGNILKINILRQREINFFRDTMKINFVLIFIYLLYFMCATFIKVFGVKCTL